MPGQCCAKRSHIALHSENDFAGALALAGTANGFGEIALTNRRARFSSRAGRAASRSINRRKGFRRASARVACSYHLFTQKPVKRRFLKISNPLGMRSGCRLIAPKVTMVASGATIFARRRALSPPTAFRRQADRRAIRRLRDRLAQFVVVEQDDIAAFGAQLVDQFRPPDDVDGPKSELAANGNRGATRRRNWPRFESPNRPGATGQNRAASARR